MEAKLKMIQHFYKMAIAGFTVLALTMLSATITFGQTLVRFYCSQLENISGDFDATKRMLLIGGSWKNLS